MDESIVTRYVEHGQEETTVMYYELQENHSSLWLTLVGTFDTIGEAEEAMAKKVVEKPERAIRIVKNRTVSQVSVLEHTQEEL